MIKQRPFYFQRDVNTQLPNTWYEVWANLTQDWLWIHRIVKRPTPDNPGIFRWAFFIDGTYYWINTSVATSSNALTVIECEVYVPPRAILGYNPRSVAVAGFVEWTLHGWFESLGENIPHVVHD